MMDNRIITKQQAVDAAILCFIEICSSLARLIAARTSESSPCFRVLYTIRARYAPHIQHHAFDHQSTDTKSSLPTLPLEN
jgi:hypothetical protein